MTIFWVEAFRSTKRQNSLTFGGFGPLKGANWVDLGNCDNYLGDIVVKIEMLWVLVNFFVM